MTIYNRNRYTQERRTNRGTEVYDSHTEKWIMLYLIESSSSCVSSDCGDQSSSSYSSYDSGSSCDSGSSGCD